MWRLIMSFMICGCSGGGLLIVETIDGGEGGSAPCPTQHPETGCDDCNPCTDDKWCELCDAIPPVKASKWCLPPANFPAWCAKLPVACGHDGYSTPVGISNDCFPVEEDAGPVRPLHTGICCVGMCIENDAQCHRDL